MSLFPVFSPTIGLPTVSFVASAQSQSVVANFGGSFSGKVVAVCCYSGDVSRNLNSVTILGNSATIHVANRDLGGVGIASFDGSFASSGTVSFSLSGGPGISGIFVYKIQNLQSGTPTDTLSVHVLVTNPGTGSIDVQKNGIIIAGGGLRADTWNSATGLNQDGNFGSGQGDLVSGHYLATATEVNRTVGWSKSSTDSGQGYMLAVSFR